MRASCRGGRRYARAIGVLAPPTPSNAPTQSLFVDFILLIFIILGLVMLASKLRLAYPIVLVLGGLGLSFTGWFGHIKLDPDIVFLVFLPPLLYEAAWQVSWKEFWRARRLIASFAFPIVILTSCLVAVVAHWLIPGFTLALGFLLGGIVSPPDAISATTILRTVKVPKVLTSVLEGESLLNDASALIVFRFALAAVLTGQFALGQAAGSFALVLVLGTAVGLAVALAFYAIARWLPTTPSIDIVLTLLAPYCMYYAAEHLHYSGVLAVVSGGLLHSSQRATLLSYQSRLTGQNVWTLLGFVLNGLVFLLIGLELPEITRQLGGGGLGRAIGYGLVVSLVLIIGRLLCAFGVAAFTRVASRFVAVAEAAPGWKLPLVTGWAGMRGVVSLASALAVPLLTPLGQPFPQRNLLLFITFVVILVTLVFQGLTLPWLIRRVNLADQDPALPEARQALLIQQQMNQLAQRFAEAHADPASPVYAYILNLQARLSLDSEGFAHALAQPGNPPPTALHQYQHLYLQLLAQQRTLLHGLNQRLEVDEEVLRQYTSFLDLEEYKLRELSAVAE